MNDITPLEGPSGDESIDAIDTTPLTPEPAKPSDPPAPEPAAEAPVDDLAARGFDPKSFSDEDEQYVEQARKMGWTDPDRFKGDPKGYVGAKRFVERGRASPAAVRQENDNLSKQVAEISEALKRQEQAAKQQRAEAVTRGYKQALTDLNKQKMEAFQSGDASAFQEADRRERELLTNPPAVETQAPSEPAYTQSWKSENAWFGTDEKRTAYAEGMADIVHSQGYTGEALLREVGRRVLEDMPLEEPRKTVGAANGFNGGTGSAEPAPRRTLSVTPTVSTLDPMAKGAFEEFLEDFGPSSQMKTYKTRADAEKAFMSAYGE